MDLVDPAVATLLEHSLAGEELFQQHRPARAIDARETRNTPTRGEGDPLRLQQDATCLTIGNSGGFLGDPRSVGLPVDRGASHKDDTSGAPVLQNPAQAVTVDGGIRLGPALSRTHGIDGERYVPQPGSKCPHGFIVGHVAGGDLKCPAGKCRQRIGAPHKPEDMFSPG